MAGQLESYWENCRMALVNVIAAIVHPAGYASCRRRFSAHACRSWSCSHHYDRAALERYECRYRLATDAWRTRNTEKRPTPKKQNQKKPQPKTTHETDTLHIN